MRSVSWLRKKQCDPDSRTVPETPEYGPYLGSVKNNRIRILEPFRKRESYTVTISWHRNRPFPAVRDSPGYRFVTSFANSIRLYVYERKNSLDIAHSQHVTIHTCYVDENEAIPQPQFLRRHQMKFINQNSNYEDEVRYMLRIK
jgi:hypothetical protein